LIINLNSYRLVFINLEIQNLNSIISKGKYYIPGRNLAFFIHIQIEVT
jgi:hypothetical protein